MATRSSLAACAVLALAASVGSLLVIAARAGAEGFSPRMRLLSQPSRIPVPMPAASAVVLPEAPPNGCPTTDAGWEIWRDTAIGYLLRLDRSAAADAAGATPPTSAASTPADLTPFLNHADVLLRSSQIAIALEQCQALGVVPPEKELGNLWRFVRTQHNANFLRPNPQHQYGHGPDMNDESYLCRARSALELPCLLKSQGFLQAMSDKSTYWRAEDLIRAQNARQDVEGCKADGQTWETLFYSSRLLTTPDEAELLGRYLVVVPAIGIEPDRWIQFGILSPADTSASAPQNVSVVAIAKPGGIGIVPFDAMADWFRCKANDPGCGVTRKPDVATLARNACWSSAASNPHDIELRFRLEASGQTDDCQRCHKSVPIGIHPLEVYGLENKVLKAVTPEAAASAVAGINRPWRLSDPTYPRASRFRAQDTNDTLADWENYGGFGFGAAPDDFLYPDGKTYLPKRTAASVQACAAGLDATTVKNDLLPAMECTGCHDANEKGRGVLNYPLGTDKRNVLSYSTGNPGVNLVRSHIMTGVMPKQKDKKLLLPEVREALFRCLSLEYFDPDQMTGLFIDWLKGETTPSTMLKASGVSSEPSTLSMAKSGLAPKAIPTSRAQLFSNRCGGCHSLRPGDNEDAPSLFGVVGRRIASAPYDHSKGLAAIGRAPSGVWSEERLLSFIADPDAFVKQRLGADYAPNMRTGMKQRVPDEAERRAIVKFLATQK